MPKALITGSYGLVGSYISTYLVSKGWLVLGLDCDARSTLFSDILPLDRDLINKIYAGLSIPTYDIDLRDLPRLEEFFLEHIDDPFDLVVHCAAQPSHDWAASNPIVDKQLNIDSTLNVCECIRRHSSLSILVHLSTNKVYGDTPNQLPLIEEPSRFELDKRHSFYHGIDQSMSIDQSLHSLFGVSKTAADLYVQEYSFYFGIPTVVLRGGCLTGPRHRGAQLHGFMNYLIRSALYSCDYTIFGYYGKQVRDNLHAQDIASLVELIYLKHTVNPPPYPLVANIGGGRSNSCSILELIHILRQDFDLSLSYSVSTVARTGDHKWYITDNGLLHSTYGWTPTHTVHDIIEETIKYLHE